MLSALSISIAACTRPADASQSSFAPPPTALDRAAAPASPPADGRLSAEQRALGVLWSFRGGAPLPAPPIVGSDGSVYLGTTEGYVHALAPDGAFRWSFTVTGPVSGQISLSGGRLYAATTAGFFYVIRSDGTLGWKAELRVRPITAARPSGGFVFFGAADHRLYAGSLSGQLLWSVPVGGQFMAGPVVSPTGQVVVVGTEQLLLVERQQRWRAPLDEAVLREPQVSARGDVYLVTSGALRVFDRDARERWSKPGFSFVTPRPDAVWALTPQGELVRLSPEGAEVARWSLDVTPSAEVCVTPHGEVLVPTEQGSLVVVNQAGIARVVPVARTPLLRPITDPLRQRVIVGAEDGTVVAVASPFKALAE